MKTKIIIVAILVLLTVVAYQKYSEYSALKFIDSYESCVTAKGSLIQESYPSTCVTKLGERFLGEIVEPIVMPPKQVTSYTSPYAKVSLTFSRPLFVTEVYRHNNNEVVTSEIYISIEPPAMDYASGLQITYGIPYLEKGGACIDEGGNGAWISKTILNQQVNVCDLPGFYSAGYPKHPNGSIEYSFGLLGSSTKSETLMYKDIVYSAKFTD